MDISAKSSWPERFQRVQKALQLVPAENRWIEHGRVGAAYARVLRNFDADMDELHRDAEFIFARNAPIDSPTQKSVLLLRRWLQADRVPSLVALGAFAIEKLGGDMPENYVHAIMMAGLLGEVENDLSYHNNMHYRKVLFNTLRLIVSHNHIFYGMTRVFDERQSALLIIAACIHDLGHDGLGNTVKGAFVQGRLEKQSWDIALPYLQAAGLDSAADQADLRMLLLCTEVTPLGDSGNPVNQMKAAYRYHYLGEGERLQRLNLDADLAVLQKDPELVMMALILHEADIAASAGYTYAMTKYETSLYMDEVASEQARPQHVIDFIYKICQRTFLSDAAQRLYSSNLARIYALAEADVDAGNKPYPVADLSDFANGETVAPARPYLKSV